MVSYCKKKHQDQKCKDGRSSLRFKRKVSNNLEKSFETSPRRASIKKGKIFLSHHLPHTFHHHLSLSLSTLISIWRRVPKKARKARFMIVPRLSAFLFFSPFFPRFFHAQNKKKDSVMAPKHELPLTLCPSRISNQKLSTETAITLFTEASSFFHTGGLIFTEFFFFFTEFTNSTMIDALPSFYRVSRCNQCH